MNDSGNDPERAAAQVEKLRGLRERRRRLALLRRVTSRRSRDAVEPDGFRRVPIRLVNTLPAARAVELDPVLVVAGEVLVPAGERERAAALLEERGLLAQEQEQAPARRQRVVRGEQSAVLPVSSAIDVRTVLRLLRSEGIAASANHVAALGGRSKAGSTPKRTDMVLPPRDGTPIRENPPVVVIDTGIDRAAAGRALLPEDNRTDGWLDDVVVDEELNGGIDLLDTVDYFGAEGADGFLDLGAGHGTFVSGLIRQHAPGANLLTVRALDTDGHGGEDTIAAAIFRAGELMSSTDGVGLLNLSLGFETIDEEEPQALAAAIDALPENVLVMAAAGNGPTGIRVWPAALAETRERVVAVGSLTRTNAGIAPSTWSNFGPWVTCSAVGEGVVSTFVEGTETEGTGAEGDPFDPEPDTFEGPNAYAMWSGTSFATAKVTGVLAAWLADHPDASIADALDYLRDEVAAGRRTADYGYMLDI